MRIQAAQTALDRGLTIVGRAVAARHSLDQLRHVHIEAGDEGLRLTATDTEIALIVDAEASVEEPGSITVPHKFLSDLVKTLTGDIEIAVAADSLVAQVKAGGSNESSIHGMSAEVYPPIPGVSDGDTMKIVAADLREGLRHVVFAAASDDGRPVLTGVHFRFNEGKMTLAAADGFRLAVYTMEVLSDLDEELEITVPARALRELAGLLADEEGTIELYLHRDRSYARFHLSRARLTAQLIQGNYPTYDQLIPSEYQTRAVLPSDQLERAVASAAVFARESSGIVRLHIDGSGEEGPQIRLTARAEELGNHKRRVDSSVEGDDSRIAYNVKYLEDIIGVARGGTEMTEVAMETSGPSNPGVFRIVGRDNYVHVLMPMFVQWEDN